jgi:branched-chain amino acid aminotransferase
MTLAGDMGMKVERRPMLVDELADFDETGACGTAAVITPIRKIVDPDINRVFEYCKDGNPGLVSTILFNKLTAIQFGDEPDTHGWIEIVG